jgi:hypothetical protein
MVMTRKDLHTRVTRIGKEERRLKKEIWNRIQKIVSKYFDTCVQFPTTPAVVFTKLKNNSLFNWDSAREYKVPFLDSDDWDSKYIGFTKDGMIAGVYYAMVMNEPYGYTVKQLHGVLKQVEKMKFNNVVNFKL